MRALQLLTIVLVMFILTAAGLLLASAWPEQFESTMTAAGRGWRTWLAGLGVLVSPLIAAGVLGLILGVAPSAAAVPLVIVLLPVVLGLGGLVLLAALFGVIPAAGARSDGSSSSEDHRRRRSCVGMFLVGIVVVDPGAAVGGGRPHRSPRGRVAAGAAPPDLEEVETRSKARSSMASSVFHRGAGLRTAVKAEGCWIVDSDGNRYLDAAGGAVVCGVGHGRREVASAIADQLAMVGYVHASTFTTAGRRGLRDSRLRTELRWTGPGSTRCRGEARRWKRP